MPIQRRYCARLLIDWLNERYGSSFELSDGDGNTFIATDGAHRAGVWLAPLWDENEGWTQHLESTAARLPHDGAYALWIPPKAGVPIDEPEASEFARLVQTAAAALTPGQRTEVNFPVVVKLAKTNDEGGYASVIGGLSRWWTRITEKVNGTFHVDSAALHRLTANADARERLWDDIGSLSHSIELGQSTEIEVDEAWKLQKLADDTSGFTLIGAPPAADASEGIAVRRTVRKRLQEANAALDALDVELRAVGLIGSYEYGELETAGATVKAVDPALFTKLEVVAVLADGEVRPTFLPRALPWAT